MDDASDQGQFISVQAVGQPETDIPFTTNIVVTPKTQPTAQQSGAIVMEGGRPKVSFLDGAFGPGSTVVLAAWAFTFVLAYVVLNAMRVLMNLGAGRLYEAKRRVAAEEFARKVKAESLVSRCSSELAYYEDHVRALGAEPVWIKNSQTP
jgi:hypothetical protein